MPPRRTGGTHRSNADGAPEKNQTRKLVECRSEPVSRVLCPRGRRSFILAGRLLAGSSDRTRGTMSGPLTLLFGLAPGGVWHARAITRAPVGSYPAISPLPSRAVYFLCHFPRVAPRRR